MKMVPFNEEGLDLVLAKEEQTRKQPTVHMEEPQVSLRQRWMEQVLIEEEHPVAFPIVKGPSEKVYGNLLKIDLENTGLKDAASLTALPACCERLSLANNLLSCESLTHVVNRLPNLKYLNISRNDLRTKTLTLSHSAIEELDLSLTGLRGTLVLTFKMRQLSVLNLSHNELQNLRLRHKLPKLKVLHLNNNHIGHLSDILEDLQLHTPRLEVLDLYGNPFSENGSKYADFEYLKNQVEAFVKSILLVDGVSSNNETYLTQLNSSTESKSPLILGHETTEFQQVGEFLNSQCDGAHVICVQELVRFRTSNVARLNNEYSSFGFFLDPSDCILPNGTFSDSPIFIHLKIPEFATHELVCVIFWPGRTYTHNDQGTSAPLTEAKSVGYDSVFISRESVFVIFNPASIVAEYAVQFDRVS